MQDAIPITETQADHIHGNTKIQPGDKVGYSGRMQRVIEVNADDSRVTIHQTGGMHSSVETIHAEAVTDYEARD